MMSELMMLNESPINNYN